MPAHDDLIKAALLDQVEAEARDRMGTTKAASIVDFIRLFYGKVPPWDLEGYSAGDLFGAAASFWKFVAKRTAGTARVRVYNPNIDEYGWTSDHTVIEVVNDDMPFLVDSVTAALSRLDLAVHLVIHPVLMSRRADDGGLVSVANAAEGEQPGGRGSVLSESFMHFQVTAQSGEVRLNEIRETVESVLADVRAAVEDWRPTLNRLGELLDGLKTAPPPVEKGMLTEARAFLKWVHEGHFTLLGYREYGLVGGGRKTEARIVGDGGMGILRNPDFLVFEEIRNIGRMPEAVRDFVLRPELLIMTKASRRSTIHRPVHMDVIILRSLDDKGKVVGLHLFVGLYTSVAYSRSPWDIPMLRWKVEGVIDHSGCGRSSHDGKALSHILDTFPRDELFQISEADLSRIALGILHLQERRRVALFVREDAFGRFASCLVFVPRDRYNTELRHQIEEIVSRAFDGGIADFYTQISDAPLARLHLIVRTDAEKMAAFDLAATEEMLIAATRSWTDRLSAALVSAHGEERGQALCRLYADAFPAGYSERFSAKTAVSDIDSIERTRTSRHLGMNLYRPIEMSENSLRFKIYHPDSSVPLSDVLPMLENMGLRVVDELPFAIRPRPDDAEDRPTVMIHDFGLETGDGTSVDIGSIRDNFQQTFIRVWRGDVEDDGFNRLVLVAGLSWREVVIVRAYAKYLRQANITFSESYMQDALVRNPRVVRLIVEMFALRFDPRMRMEATEDGAALESNLTAALDAVVNADEDRILRRFLNLVSSTLRTNHFQQDADGGPKPYLSFKLDSGLVEELPAPRPWREIFVYSPRVEGVHLRGGAVARGGLRWSDRREDFRTEILGLVKAQMVKNAVIVPVGSKGGFVLKRAPDAGGREAFLEEGIACYQTFIRGLLDITDNLVEGRVSPPADVVRLDDDDPYLVVAADKGTATFSDIANGVAAEYGFWLGDAFASGGAYGYDHKKMAITARGGWESVKRHFREIDIDIQSQDFTVLGVGDMGGDVFGNGMLLSRHIRLLGAFNHRHIFIDPDPDAARTWEERKRLFDAVKGWEEYDQKLISKGGGIFERSAKTITLTPEIKALFGIEENSLAPNALIRVMLKSQVDLLWFGGIGTYVKASTETAADVGDRANDALRIDGRDLRARVIGEGANLGVTQRGRIEFALAGGRLNTDAIDNSGGVDCSDHEVNIKILLDAVVAAGDMTMKQRNKLLVDMTDEVADLVLRDNYLQSQAISMVESHGLDILDHQTRMMRMLERTGRLNRAVEFLPDDEALAEREGMGRGLTRPEIAVLMSYSKIWLYGELLNSDLPDDPQLFDDMVRYFPTPLGKKFKAAIAEHRLRREIIATHITNSLINRVGGTFVTQLEEKTGMPPSEIARAYLVARDVFRLREVWAAIDDLDNKVPTEAQNAMRLEANRLMERGTLWFLRHGQHPLDIGANVAAFSGGVAALESALGDVLRHAAAEGMEERAANYDHWNVPADLSKRVAHLLVLVSGCDIVRIADDRNLNVDAVADLYFAIGPRFSLGWMRAMTERLSSENHWQKLATTALIEDLYRHQSNLTLAVLDTMAAEKEKGALSAEQAITKWARKKPQGVARADSLLEELRAVDAPDFAMLAVTSRQIQTLTD
ncbi:MAG: NAD-glutamate dehydrogenase [Rhodospirillales bacterium]|nr:NAD-glutamate dehydrogenase [Rhodospirillales bacterium]